ncbi:hypothetical protein KI614_14395 [Dechloromonas denitrificans]|uniref:hypothetical protein n=1 Tax=Dechloromonas denitrificans TaxID=281362 RepID=UPI001CF8D650|nr:hypothetical protein [Dechloromonas denitrificans]UCV11318.1 hypothetical protein KI614_14395 [Dechloromonas denitrificans]
MDETYDDIWSIRACNHSDQLIAENIEGLVLTKKMRGPIGGSASTAGAKYGASIAAWAATRMLLGARASLPWLLPQGSFICDLWCESESEVDDLVLKVMPQAKVFIQMKHGLAIGSEFDKAIAQLARQYADLKFNSSTDRLVIVSDPSASGSIRCDFIKALSWFHNLPVSQPLTNFPHGKGPSSVLARVQRIFDSEYSKHRHIPTEVDWRGFLGAVHLTILDPMSGNDYHACVESLNTIVASSTGNLAWKVISDLCLEAGRLRRPMDAAALISQLTCEGISIRLRTGQQPTLTGVCAEFNKSQIAALIKQKRYDKNSYVMRADLNTQLNRFLESNEHIFLVAGGSGQGKTTWCVSQAEQDDEQIRVLIPAEYIGSDDLHLRDTLGRFLNRQAEELHLSSFSTAEIINWFRSTSLLIFLDGLDRALIPRNTLQKWLQNTMAEAEDSAGRFVFTTRPEIFEVVKSALGSKLKIAGLEEFSEFEAIQAAEKLGIPELAKYRHPRMMSFCANLWSIDLTKSFRPEEAVAAFIKHAVAEIAFEYSLLSELIEIALDDLGMELANSPSGLLEADSLRRFLLQHNSIYIALRKSNFLSVHHERGRLEVDEIAEHLAGRHVCINEELTNWSSINESPLKVGALRSALEQLAARDPAAAFPFVEQLAETYIRLGDKTCLSLVCSSISAHTDLIPFTDIALRLANSWRKSNLFSSWGPGRALLDLVSNCRWNANFRLSLLWSLAKNESGYDWRTKHWLTPSYAPNFHVTEWRSRFLKVIAETPAESLRFLLDWFDSDIPLQDTNEAAMCNLAQGCFFLTAKSRLETALELLANDKRPSCRLMLDYLAHSYPEHIHQVLLNGADFLPFPTKVGLALAMTTDDGPHPAATQLAQHWLRVERHQAEQHLLLRILSHAGDAAAAQQLIACESLALEDISALYGLAADNFSEVLDELLKREAIRDQVLHGLAVGRPKAEHVLPLSRALLKVFNETPPTNELGRLTESILYAASGTNEPKEELLKLVAMVIARGNAEVRMNLVFFAAGNSEDRMLSERKQSLQVSVLNMLKDRENAPENLKTLAQFLILKHSEDSFVRSYLLELGRRHPNSICFSDLGGWTAATEKLTSYLDKALRE